MICETVVGKITLSFQLDITILYLNAYEMHMLDKVRLEFSKLFWEMCKGPFPNTSHITTSWLVPLFMMGNLMQLACECKEWWPGIGWERVNLCSSPIIINSFPIPLKCFVCKGKTGNNSAPDLKEHQRFPQLELDKLRRSKRKFLVLIKQTDFAGSFRIPQ